MRNVNQKTKINLLQIFCEILLHSQVIFKSMKEADDTSRGTLEWEWVNVNDIYQCPARPSIQGGREICQSNKQL